MALLTDATVRSLLAPEKGQKLYADDSLPGFFCRVSQGGTKSFVLVHGADRRFITIGRYPTITLSDARKEAKRLLAEFTLGKTRPRAMPYPQAADLFLADKAESRRPSTVHGYKLKLGRLKFKCHLTDITPDEFARKLGRITAPSERSHVLVAARVFFRWCVKRRYIEHDPTFGLSKPKGKRRTRVLSPDEIRALWKVPGEFADYVRLLLCTGQRVTEPRRALVTVDTMTIPADISKNHRAHTIPFLPLARSFWRPFTFYDWSHAKTELDEASGVTGWVLSDCRRTARTGWSMLGVPPHVSERLLNHITGQTELEQVYDQYDFFKEMQAALSKWEARLSELCGIPQTAPVC